MRHDSDSSLWRCPKCGHEFVTRNLSHSCVRISIASHFEGRAAALRPAFDAIAHAAESCGQVTVYAQKTRIVLQRRVRFASVVVRAGFLDLGLWLTAPMPHRRAFKTDSLGSLGCYLHVRVEAPGDVDAALRRLLRAAYRQHLEPPATPRERSGIARRRAGAPSGRTPGSH